MDQSPLAGPSRAQAQARSPDGFDVQREQPTDGVVRSPQLRSVNLIGHGFWLPPDLYSRIIHALPHPAFHRASLVCHEWRRIAATMRSDLALRKVLAGLQAPSAGLMQARDFDACLQQLAQCPAGTKGNALRDIAILLAHVEPEDRFDCLNALLGHLPLLSMAWQRWLLCQLAARVQSYLGDVKTYEPPGSTLAAYIVNKILERAGAQPLVGQAMIVAAMADVIPYLDVDMSLLDARFAAAIDRCSNHPMEQDGGVGGLAEALGVILGTSLLRHNHTPSLKEYGFYRLPLAWPAADASYPGDHHGTKVATPIPPADPVTLAYCQCILKTPLEWEEKRRVLMFSNDRGRPLISQEGIGRRIFAIYERLQVDMHARVALVEAVNEKGETVLNVLLRKLVWKIDAWRLGKCVPEENCIRQYVECVSASKALGENEKVRVLRGGVRASPEERSLLSFSEYSALFRLGPAGEAPFCGLCAIDSLVCDVSEGLMQTYMLEILQSSLDDESKARVLRLDYPDRSGLPGMHSAHKLYCKTIGESQLPDKWKRWLIAGAPSDWQVGCSLI